MSRGQSLHWLFVRLPLDPDAPSRPCAAPLPWPKSTALVTVGGIAGSLARAWIAKALPHSSSAWPWSTLAVNVIGSGVLAFSVVVLIERYPLMRFPWPLIGTGLIGGFTTFSTFALDAFKLGHNGRLDVAIAYVGATLAATVVAALAGFFGGRALDRLLDRERWRRRIRHAVYVQSTENA